MRGNPIYKRWWFWVGIVLIIIIIAAVSGGNDKGPGTVDEGDKIEKSDEKKPVIEFSNVVVKSSYGTTMVAGEAVNNDDKAHSFTIKVSFYDKGGKLLGTAVGAMNDLNGGESKIFTAMGSDDFTSAAEYKVQVDTIISSDTNKENPIEFSNIITRSDFGTTTVEGEAKNNGDTKHSFTVVVGFYDKDKKLLGTAAGAVNDLAPGETKTFTAMAAEDYSKADSYKVQVDTLIE
ncbi:MAG TPA: hypothetical protein GXX36_06820 [Clostridiaceae bacterium]|nr:hypothetical protein [Clostridiaceae bacterium]